MPVCSHQGLDADTSLKTCRDTGESKKETKSSDIYFREVFDSSPDLITVLDNQQRITYINKAASDAIGYTPENARGLHCYQMFHNTDHPPASCPHARLIQDGQVHQEEIFEKKTGAWFLVSVSPLYDVNGQLIGSIHSARDITTLKKTEQALRESEERYHQLSEATLEGVLLSEATRILAANQVLADMVGYDVNDLKGMSLIRFVTAGDRKRMIDYFRSGMTGDIEVECIRKDRTTFPIAAHTRQVTYQGRPVFQTAIRDLTLIKQSEKARIHHERLKGVLQMAGAVCHEINQPLMALMGYIDIINTRKGTKSSTEKALVQIGLQVDRINRLTKKLMSITHYKTKDYVGGEQIIDIDLSAGEH